MNTNTSPHLTGHHRRAVPALLVSSLLLVCQSAQAATESWTGATSGLWGTNTNWSASITPDSTYDLTIQGPSDAVGALTINVNAAAAANSINFTDTAAVTLDNTSGSTQTLTLGGGGLTTGTGLVTIGSATAGHNVNVALGASQTWTVGSGGLTITNVVSGTGFGITKEGTGTMTLSGANTYTGATAVNTGVLNVRNTTAVTTTSGITVASGAQLKISGVAVATIANTAITGTGINNDGALLLDNTLGTTRYGNTAGTVTVSGNAYIGAIGGTLSSANQLGLIAGSGGWTKVGSGVLSITGAAATANTYTGAVEVKEGTLIVNKNIGVLAITGDLKVDSGATWGGSNSGGAISSTSNVTNNGAFYLSNRTSGTNTINETINSLSGTGTIQMSSSNVATQSGTITVSSTTTNSSFSGNILADSSGATLSLTKAGAGTTLTLSGANTYTGTTTITGGTLQLGANNAFSAASALVLTGGTIDLQSFSTSAASLSFNAAQTLKFNLGTPGNSTALLALTGNLTKSGTGIYTVDFSGSGAAGTYKLVSFAGTTFAQSDFTIANLGSGFTGTLTMDATTLSLTVVSAVPEPSTCALLGGAAVLGVVVLRRKRRALA